MEGNERDSKHKVGMQHGVKGYFVPHADIESVPWGVDEEEADMVRIRESFEPASEFGSPSLLCAFSVGRKGSRDIFSCLV